MNYEFCPKCAGRLEATNVSHPVCLKCGYVFYQNSKPTASAVIQDGEGKVLLVKRAMEPSYGKWDLPGGFLENGEDPIVGLKREAKEELSLAVEPGNILTVCVDEYGYEKGELYTLNLFYRSKAQGKIKLDKENSEYGWFGKDEIPWNELAFKNTHVALKALYKLDNLPL